MAAVSRSKNGFSVRAHVGDAKTLLAFNLPDAQSKNLAAFTIWCQPGDPKKQDGYYLLNSLQFENPAHHAQDDSLPANASLNAPFHKFRWLHVPGTSHQGLEPFYGDYTYTVTPRYFNDKAQMQPLDKGRTSMSPLPSRRLKRARFRWDLRGALPSHKPFLTDSARTP